MSLLEKLIQLRTKLSTRFKLVGQIKLPEQTVEKARFNAPGVAEHYGDNSNDPYPNQAKIAVYNLVDLTINLLNSRGIIEKGRAVAKASTQLRSILRTLDKNTWVPFIVDEETRDLGRFLKEFLEQVTQKDFEGYPGVSSKNVFSQLSSMKQILDRRLANYQAADVKGHEINKQLTDQYTIQFIDLSASAQAELKTIQNTLINDLSSQNNPEELTQILIQAIDSTSAVKEDFEKLDQLEFDNFIKKNDTLPDSELRLNFLGNVPKYAKEGYQKTLNDVIDYYYEGTQAESIRKQYQNELNQPLDQIILSLLATDEKPPIYHDIFRYLETNHGTKFIEAITYKNAVNYMHTKKRKETISNFNQFISALNEVKDSLQKYLDLREQVKNTYIDYSKKSENLQLNQVQNMVQKSELLEIIEKNIPIVKSINKLLGPKKQNPIFAALNPFEDQPILVSNRLQMNKTALEGMDEEYFTDCQQVKELYAAYSKELDDLKLDEVQTLAQRSALLEDAQKNISIVESIGKLLEPKKQNPVFEVLNPFNAPFIVVSKRLQSKKADLESMQGYLTHSQTINELYATYSQGLDALKLDESFPDEDTKARKVELLDLVNRNIEVVQSIKKTLVAIENDPHVERLNLKKPNPFKNEVSDVLKDLQNKKAALEGINPEPRKKTKVDSNYDQRLENLNSSINQYFKEIHGLEREIYRSKSKGRDLAREYVNLKKEIENLSKLIEDGDKISDAERSPKNEIYSNAIKTAIQEKQLKLEKMLPRHLTTINSLYAKEQLDQSFLRMEKAFIERKTDENETKHIQDLKSTLKETFEYMKRKFKDFKIDWNHYDKRFTLTQQLFSMMSNHAELIENKPKIETIIQELEKLGANTENLKQDLTVTLKSIEPFIWSIEKAKTSLKAIQENEVKLSNVKDDSLSQLFTQTEGEFLSLDNMLTELENLFIDVSSLKEQREKLEINVSVLKAQTSLKRIQGNEEILREALSDANNLKNASLMQLFPQTQEEFLSLDKTLAKLEKFSSDLSSLKKEKEKRGIDVSSLTAQKEKLDSNIASAKEQRKKLGDNISSLETQKEEKIKQKIKSNRDKFEEEEQDRRSQLVIEAPKYDLADYKKVSEYLHNIERVQPKPLEQIANQVSAITQEINKINKETIFPDIIETFFAMVCQLFNWKTNSQRRTEYSEELKTAYNEYKEYNSYDSLTKKINEGIENFPNEPFVDKLKNLKTSLPVLEVQQTSTFSNN